MNARRQLQATHDPPRVDLQGRSIGFSRTRAIPHEMKFIRETSEIYCIMVQLQPYSGR